MPQVYLNKYCFNVCVKVRQIQKKNHCNIYWEKNINVSLFFFSVGCIWNIYLAIF